MTLDDAFVSRALFHPRAEDCDYISRGMPTQTQCNDAVISGYLHESKANDSILLFFHGNGEIAADYDSLSTIFTACGIAFWVVDYRGYGRSTGTPSFSHMVQDAEAVLDDIPRVAERARRQFRSVFVMGRSLGSASAIHLASIRAESLAGLILDSPFADGLSLIQRLGGPRLDRQALPGRENNIDKMRRCTVPCLIIHGTDDRIIPLSDAESLYEACPGSTKELLRIVGAGHNNLLAVGLEDYCRRLKDFIVRGAGSNRKG